LSQQWVFEWISALATAVKLAFKRLCAKDSLYVVGILPAMYKWMDAPI
jgi:hypothetical protein